MINRSFYDIIIENILKMESKVQLHVYDLTGGMAKGMSKQFLGIEIEGVWHTGVVVFGK